MVSHAVRPTPGGSSSTPMATADEADEAGLVGTVADAPNGAMCGQPS
jgi:hypothetical protein